MSLLRRIFTPALPVAWEITPGGVIWKLLPTVTGRLVGEARDPETRRMRLFGVEPGRATITFRDLELDEPWWIALEATAGDLAVLHRFPRPDLPMARGVVAVEAATGRIVADDPAIRLLASRGTTALVERLGSTGEPSLELIDLSRGAVVESLGGDVERAMEFQSTCSEEELWAGWTAAEPLDEAHPLRDRLSGRMAREVREAIGTPWVAASGAWTAVTMQERSRGSAEAALGNLVDTHLLVFSGDRLRHRETVSRALPMTADDLFFIWNRELVYIRDRRTLAGIPLNEP